MAHNKKQPKFPIPESVGDREWGREELLVLASNKYTLKKIFMKAGARGGLQYHRLKDECGIMISGEMIVKYDDGNGKLIDKSLQAGDVFHFEPGVVHQAIAVSDTVYIEASTPHFDDRVHVEHLYGIAEEAGGLPSTNLEQIVTR